MDSDILGYIAGSLTTICFIPQAYKIIAHKNCEGISLLMYAIFTIGVAFWLSYGVSMQNTPIIIFNAITLLLSVVILFNIIKHRKNA